MLTQLEARRFVGRGSDLATLERLLGPDAPAPVVFVHGPGGIGKSALLRELSRRASRRGLAVRRIDGRDPGAAQATIEPALEEMQAGECSLLLLDTYEQVLALGGLLRASLAPALAAGARLVIAGRRPPEPAWLQDGWQEALLSLHLRPLSAADSRELLAARGVDGAGRIEPIVAWAKGSPLALAVAADALLAGNRLDLDRLDADGALAATLVGRLAGTELEGADRDALAVAAIARAVDAPLLAAVLPGLDGDRAESWLRDLSFAEPLGTRVTLHERVRKAVRGALLASDPEHERELRRRLADHLGERAGLGEMRLLLDIAELIDDPDVRWGIAPPSTEVRTDRIRPGDRAELETLLDAAGTEWWARTCRWIEEAPEHVTVVRDATGNLVGWGIWVTPANAPGWVGEDPILGPWLADAQVRAPDGDVLLFRDCPDDLRETGAAVSPVLPAANLAVALGSGVRTARYMYGTTNPDNPHAHQSLLALNFERVPALDIEDGERTVCCYFGDWGPGGLVRTFRDLVYADLGLPPPPPASADTASAETVRSALRCFHDPVALAALPLGRGASAAERVEATRRLLREATAAAFGDSPDQRLLRATVERGYFDANGGHTQAMRELNVSRTTYFRRLAEASDRVARLVLDGFG